MTSTTGSGAGGRVAGRGPGLGGFLTLAAGLAVLPVRISGPAQRVLLGPDGVVRLTRAVRLVRVATVRPAEPGTPG